MHFNEVLNQGEFGGNLKCCFLLWESLEKTRFESQDSLENFSNESDSNLDGRSCFKRAAGGSASNLLLLLLLILLLIRPADPEVELLLDFVRNQV